MKKIKAQAKVNVAEPVEIDEMRVIGAKIDFVMGKMVLEIAMMDDGSIVANRSLEIGLIGHEGLAERIQEDLTDVLDGIGLLPGGNKT